MSAIDFAEYGTITHHPDIGGYEVLQFHPHDRTDLVAMLELLDSWLAIEERERSILLQSSKRYPIPCVIIHKPKH